MRIDKDKRSGRIEKSNTKRTRRGSENMQGGREGLCSKAHDPPPINSARGLSVKGKLLP